MMPSSAAPQSFNELPSRRSPDTQPAEHAMAVAEAQPVLFAERPSRRTLLSIPLSKPSTPISVRIHRNHAFEHVAAVMPPWLWVWNRDARFIYSDYDDSLAFEAIESSGVDLEIVWFDLKPFEGGFQPGDISAWLCDRLMVLRQRSPAPIIVAVWGDDPWTIDRIEKRVREVPGVRFGNLRFLAASLGNRLFDERAAKYSGTRFSDAACLLVARELACHWIPALLLPRLRAVAVDLDNTLYQGVLGEEGREVHLTPGHLALQRFLIKLRETGVFLALISRNEEKDVRDLFEVRTDFPLRWQHFSATAVGWQSKADGIRHIAEELRLGVDSILLLDDNAGEMLAVVSAFPGVPVVHAPPDANLTKRTLELYPGLWAWEETLTDALRLEDLKASGERSIIARSAPSHQEYLHSLQISIQIRLSARDQLGRLRELSEKTNQFNLNLERHSEVQLAHLLDASDHRLAIVSLKDRLSDSGYIALIIGRLEEKTLVVRELAISCRALGRGLEDVIIGGALEAILLELPAPQVAFLHRTGPRNHPARAWLSRRAGQDLPPEGRVEIGPAWPRLDAQAVSLDIIQSL